MKSIIQDRKECFICKSIYGLQEHHIFFGTANRKKSEQEGLKVWLCLEHHTGSKISPHYSREVDLKLKRIAQAKYEETHTREEFMQLFGKNYLD